MKYRIKITEQDFKELRQLVLSDHPQEGAAFALAGVTIRKDTLDVIVRRIISIPKKLFTTQEEYHLKLSSQAINGLISLCECNRLGIVICHSHFSDIPYSASDDFGEKRIIEVLRKYIPDNAPTASLIFYPGGVRGRIWLPHVLRPVPVSEIIVIGNTIQLISPEPVAKKKVVDSELFDRQILAFGERGQSLISSTKVGIVGVGGTGSSTAEQLIRLGVQDIVLIDKDHFEKPNLTRVYGTFVSDVPRRLLKQILFPCKVNLVARHLKRINPKAIIRAVPENVVMRETANLLFDRDFIFLCTDNHWSRSIVNELAYQYFIPTINMGVRIDAPDKIITGASGVVDVLRPDLPCLWCRGSVSAERITAESMPAEERSRLIREGYAENVGTNAPSVVSLTTTIAGLSVSVFLQLITGFMGEYGEIQRLNYDILTGTVRRGTTQVLDKCICKKVRGYGDLRELSVLS
ncbi:MAG: ThiF family adenylyltransferase [Actinomycetota bacterium]